MEIKRYCAGVLTDDVEDFYWDTLFVTFEEAVQWGINHECTHIYDDIEDRFYKIGE